MILKKEELNQTYLLAFSGGPDSVYLLYKLAKIYKNNLNKHISIAYVNYHDSIYVKQEEEIVNFYIKKYNLTLYKRDVKFRKKGNNNFEDWAREYRYNFFSKIIRENKIYALLTAHQKSDLVETYLLQSQRNNLPLYYGLKRESILKQIKIIRPILNVHKIDLINELDKKHIKYYDDITNQNIKKQRNKIRQEISKEEMDSYIEEINSKNAYLAKLYKDFSLHSNPTNYSYYLNLNIEEQKRFCFYLLDEKKIKKEREKLGKFIFDFLKKRETNQLKLNETYTLYRTKNFFFISKDFNKICYEYTYTKPKKYKNKFFTIDLSNIASFNLTKLPVTIRNFHLNDTISTNLKIKDVEIFLHHQDVPIYLIPLYPVFLVNNKIVCVPFYKDIKNKKIPLRLNYLNGI